tara:strand:+ start:7855 stop:8622 length:768 start_codon:yes stop_codon:yes gene_type:complete
MTEILLLSNLGLGDNIFSISAINYLSEKYKVSVIVKKHNYEIFKKFFTDKNIDFFIVKGDNEVNKLFGNKLLMTYNNKKILRAGCHKINSNLSTFPFFMYDDINIPREVLKTHFKVRNTNKAVSLYNSINNMKYVFICNETSGGELFDIDKVLNQLKINKHETLIICSNKNVYDKTHKFHKISEKFVYKTNNINILDYKLIIENAEYNILSDSSLFCFAIQLNIINNNNLFFTRNKWVNWNNLLKFYNNKFKLIG